MNHILDCAECGNTGVITMYHPTWVKNLSGWSIVFTAVGLRQCMYCR